LLEVICFEVPAENVRQLQEHRAGNREFRILGDVKLRVVNAVRANKIAYRLILEDLRERAGVCKHRRECIQAVSNVKYWK